MADFSLEALSLDGDTGHFSSTPSKSDRRVTEEQILNATQSLSLNDGGDGDMEMDGLSNQSTPGPGRNLFTETKMSHSFTPKRSSPLKLSQSANDTDKDMFSSDNDVTMADVTSEDPNMNQMNSPRSPLATMLLNPTALGARVATTPSSPRLRKLDLKTHRLKSEAEDSLIAELDQDVTDDDSSRSLISDSSALGTPSTPTQIKRRANHQPKASSNLSKYMTNSDSETTTDDTEDLTVDSSSIQSSPSLYMTPWSKQPVQLQVHQHHHHYYSPQHPQSQRQFGYDGYDEQSVVLPSPWSNNASPKAPTPYLISSYLQLLFNAMTSGIAIYILISAIRTVRSDINHKMEEYAAEIALEIRSCTRSYMENRCDPSTRVAALEELCIGWERCMNRDPRVQAGKASVSAETLGLILNSLIEPIGGKAMMVFALGFVAWAFASNFIFGFVRAKSYYGWHEDQNQHQQLDFPQQSHQMSLPPPTPSQQWDGYQLSPSKR